MSVVARVFVKPKYKGQLNHITMGKEYDIPLCCRINFVVDSYLGIASGVARAVVECEYVPCWIHYFRRKHRSREWRVGIFGVPNDVTPINR